MESENRGKPQPHHLYPKVRILHLLKPEYLRKIMEVLRGESIFCLFPRKKRKADRKTAEADIRINLLVELGQTLDVWCLSGNVMDADALGRHFYHSTLPARRCIYWELAAKTMSFLISPLDPTPSIPLRACAP